MLAEALWHRHHPDRTRLVDRLYRDRVTDWLQISLSVLSLLVALLAIVYVVRDRPADRVLVAAVGVLWLGTIVQLVYGVVALAGTDRDVHGVVFVLYLLGLVAVPPAAVVWARGEPSRAGSGVVVVAALLVPFLLLRLDTLWSGGA
jgi:hypothetical protein